MKRRETLFWTVLLALFFTGVAQASSQVPPSLLMRVSLHRQSAVTEVRVYQSEKDGRKFFARVLSYQKEKGPRTFPLSEESYTKLKSSFEKLRASRISTQGCVDPDEWTLPASQGGGIVFCLEKLGLKPVEQELKKVIHELLAD